MYYKAQFLNSITDEIFEENNLVPEISYQTGEELIHFGNHLFEVSRNENGGVNKITFCNECVKTYDIEEKFIELLGLIIEEDNEVTIFDSAGLEEITDKDGLENLI